jgi:hypothetical protein
LSSWVSFVAGVVVVVVVVVVAMKTDVFKKLPMSSHLLHLRRRIHD